MCSRRNVKLIFRLFFSTAGCLDFNTCRNMKMITLNILCLRNKYKNLKIVTKKKHCINIHNHKLSLSLILFNVTPNLLITTRIFIKTTFTIHKVGLGKEFDF